MGPKHKFFIFLWYWGLNPGHSTTELHSQPFFFFWDRITLNRWVWPPTFNPSPNLPRLQVCAPLSLVNINILKQTPKWFQIQARLRTIGLSDLYSIFRCNYLLPKCFLSNNEKEISLNMVAVCFNHLDSHCWSLVTNWSIRI